MNEETITADQAVIEQLAVGKVNLEIQLVRAQHEIARLKAKLGTDES